jgi:hypothetical protein
MLIDAVDKHEYVLKDSLGLIRLLESISLLAEHSLDYADAATLHLSIDIEDGMKALEWFMAKHSSVPRHLQPKYLKLARSILQNNYSDCQGIDSAFLKNNWNRYGNVLSCHTCYDLHDMVGNAHCRRVS